MSELDLAGFRSATTKPRRDPRACETAPPDFNHLTLAEAWEHERLEAEFRKRSLNLPDMRRLRDLRARRYVPPNLGGNDARRSVRDSRRAHRALHSDREARR